MRRLLLVLVALVVAGGQVATADTRPPIPTGGKQVTPGHLAGVCHSAGDDGYGPNYGYYYSNRSKAWISAPRCVPRWGNLEILRSTVVRADGTVTMTAVPTDGSNSAQYAPETKSITWTYPGRRVSGCGNDDLSCTTVPLRKAGKEWQWGLFHVTMPRTFFVDSPGSNCAGIHLCGGAGTNAWGFAGVPPKGQEPPETHRISGTVTKSCDAVCHGSDGLGGVTVTAKGGGDTLTATTNGKGRYVIDDVPKASYTVTPKLDGYGFRPADRKVAVAKHDVDGVDFSGCNGSGSARDLVAHAAADVIFRGSGVSTCGKAQTFTATLGGASSAAARIDLVWVAGFDGGGSCTRGSISISMPATRTFDVELHRVSGNPATGSIAGHLNYDGRRISGLTITTATVGVQYAETSCTATLSGASELGESTR